MTAGAVPDGYGIHISSEAIRGLHRLPIKVVAAVIEFGTIAMATNPHQLSRPLRGELGGYRSARRGDYRILIRIDEDQQAVLVIRVDHRAHAYRPL